MALCRRRASSDSRIPGGIPKKMSAARRASASFAAAIMMTREPISLAAAACSRARLRPPPGGERMKVSVRSSVTKYSSCAHSSSSEV